MKVRITKDENNTIVTNEDGKVILKLENAKLGGRDITQIINKMFPKVEIIE